MVSSFIKRVELPVVYRLAADTEELLSAELAILHAQDWVDATMAEFQIYLQTLISPDAKTAAETGNVAPALVSTP